LGESAVPKELEKRNAKTTKKIISWDLAILSFFMFLLILKAQPDIHQDLTGHTVDQKI
jgi:hypothetical protein